MATVVKSFDISGVDGYVVYIETDTIYGQPSVNIVGLGDKAVRESSQRLHSSLINCKYEFAKMKIVFNLAPSALRKRGAHFDLGMAIGLLSRTNQLSVNDLDDYGFIGELSLNGQIRSVIGILPMVIAAKENNIKNVIVPKSNVEEASLVNGINIYGFDTLKDVTEFLEGKLEYNNVIIPKEETQNINNMIDFSEVKGQEEIIKYVVVAAAGGHNMLMIGQPGCGKSMIAKRIPTILPKLTDEEALEVTKIYSVAGFMKNSSRLISERPFRAPHHNASPNSLIGGSNEAIPGEVSLAHNGVLFLDEIAEFNGRVLDFLRQPLEDKVVTISRVNSTNTYPCNFMLIAAMNPCPCGYYGSNKCHCSDYEIIKYRNKISGPIMDRIDIQKYVNPINFSKITKSEKGRSSKELRENIERAREIQKERYKNIKGINVNSQMNSALLEEYCRLDSEGKDIFEKTCNKFNYTARSINRFLKIARTFADLEGIKYIRKKDIIDAIMARDLEKDYCNMAVV